MMTMAPNNGYRPILNLLEQAHKSLDAGATVAAIAMVYIGIDTMAWLALPVGQDRQTRLDFCNWVDTYLKADSQQPYQYEGLDVYAARCAVLHEFSTVAELHRANNPPRKFGYRDNGSHRADGDHLVLISAAMLIRDFSHAVARFDRAAQADNELKARIDSRVQALLDTTPIK
jgi:hypothetical protein